mmetsp:Transcript_9465/g.32234  ORF Transcript_9465/g.32234 Transcript_9465/m.32234 type:complete len:232 (-) Transcript_9465:1014-1709(-)
MSSTRTVASLRAAASRCGAAGHGAASKTYTHASGLRGPPKTLAASSPPWAKKRHSVGADGAFSDQSLMQSPAAVSSPSPSSSHAYSCSPSCSKLATWEKLRSSRPSCHTWATPSAPPVQRRVRLASRGNTRRTSPSPPCRRLALHLRVLRHHTRAPSSPAVSAAVPSLAKRASNTLPRQPRRLPRRSRPGTMAARTWLGRGPPARPAAAAPAPPQLEAAPSRPPSPLAWKM